MITAAGSDARPSADGARSQEEPAGTVEQEGAVEPFERLAVAVRGRLAARQGVAVLLTGRAGAGKSYLLSAVAARCADVADVHRLSGAETEAGLPLAVIDRISTRLTGTGRGAALPDGTDGTRVGWAGIRTGAALDRSTMDAFVELLAVRAAQRPVVLLLDNAEWFDDDSHRVLTYAARRVTHLPVAFVVAGRRVSRRQYEEFDAWSPPQLDAVATQQLVREHGGTEMDLVVASALAVDCDGLPGVVVDVSRELAQRPRRLDDLLCRPLPLSAGYCESVLADYPALSTDARLWLLLAASDPDRCIRTVNAAARALGVAADAYAEAEAAGLVLVSNPLQFADLSIPTVVRASASAPEIRRVHTVLATAARMTGTVTARAWHLAGATALPDDHVADEIWAAADAFAAPMTFLHRAKLMSRAAELSGDSGRRLQRLQTAAQQAALAGATSMSLALSEVSREPGEPQPRPTAAAGLHDLVSSRTPDPDPGGGGPGNLTGRGIETPDAIVQRLVRSRGHWRDGSLASDLLDAILLADGDGVLVARAPLEGVIRRILRADDADLAALAPFGVTAALLVWDADAVRALIAAGRAAAVTRRGGGPLRALDGLADAGRLVLGIDIPPHEALDQRLDLDDEPGTEAGALPPSVPGSLTRRLAHLFAEGAHHEALAVTLDPTAGQSVPTTPLIWWVVRGGTFLADAVDAAVHSGDHELAVSKLAELEDLAAGLDSSWVDGLVARSRALVDERAAAGHFERALELLTSVDAVGEVGRTHLLYGEWLRRQRRRGVAAQHLAAAGSVLARLGHPLHLRADRGLALADGGTEKPPAIEAAAHPGVLRVARHLTQQEYAVARLAARGARNSEIAESLVVSPHTVDYHLRKVFRKLDISDRRALGRLLHGTEPT